jgi:hypothetical protein
MEYISCYSAPAVYWVLLPASRLASRKILAEQNIWIRIAPALWYIYNLLHVGCLQRYVHNGSLDRQQWRPVICSFWGGRLSEPNVVSSLRNLYTSLLVYRKCWLIACRKPGKLILKSVIGGMLVDSTELQIIHKSVISKVGCKVGHNKSCRNPPLL